MSSPGAATKPSRDIATCHRTAVMATTILK
jgi:hypothetical protein